MISGLIVGLFVISIFLIISRFKNPQKILKKKPNNIQSFSTDKSIESAFESIKQFSEQSNYKMEAVDEENFKIVFGDSVSSFSWGFFYPIYLSKTTNGETKIEIGIKSKAAQIGPVVSSKHDAFLKKIKDVVN